MRSPHSLMDIKIMHRVLRLLVIIILFTTTAKAQPIFQDLVQSHALNIIKGSVKTAPKVIESIQRFGGKPTNKFLLEWQSKNLWSRRSDGLIFLVKSNDKKKYTLFDLETYDIVGIVKKNEIKQIKPNSGVRGLIGTALVSSQLTSNILANRIASLESLTRNPKRTHLEPLRKAILKESDPKVRSKMERLERLLTMQYDTDTVKRIAAIKSFSNDLGLDVRARLNPILETTLHLSQTPPKAGSYARILDINKTDRLTRTEAYDMIVKQGWATANISPKMKRTAIIKHIKNGRVAGFDIKDLNLETNRNLAYSRLTDSGLVSKDVNDTQIQLALNKTFFYEQYIEPSTQVVITAKNSLASIKTKVSISQGIDLFLDGLSLASIFFLAAIGLAITFGVMGVINMAHGEFIMMGAYTGYLIQQYITNYTLSIIIAIPIAFAVTFTAGVLMERLIIRHLYHRPLETLLATFGVSIALQQLAKNIFGTQARPLTSPDWLGGAWAINDVISISWIRVAIFGLSILFFVMLWFTLNKTRLGLETRAVTQNPRMAASMGINPDKINMLTFGLGSGIAGIAGIAIGLFAKVTSELGSDYIVQSFMTVVVGGVGNIWGTLAGAAMIGFLQKSIEWFNPSNTLAAQTFMIIFIIVFIQFRPRGIIALRGRAAGD